VNDVFKLLKQDPGNYIHEVFLDKTIDLDSLDFSSPKIAPQIWRAKPAIRAACRFLPGVGGHGGLRHGGPHGAVHGPAPAPEVGAAERRCRSDRRRRGVWEPRD